MNEFSISRRELHALLKQEKDSKLKYDYAFSRVEDALQLDCKPEKLRQQVRRDVVRECSRIIEKWRSAGRSESWFLSKNEVWLDKMVTFSCTEAEKNEEEEEEQRNESGSLSFGRPSKTFDESSDRSKRRRTEDLRKKHSTPELSYAAKMKLRASGKLEEAKLIGEALETTPTRATKITSAWRQSKSQIIKPYTPEEALALMTDARLSRADYDKIRKGAKFRNADIYPSYKVVQAEKPKCYPPKEFTTVSESAAKVNLQALLDHTAKRICELSKEVLDSIPENQRSSLELVSKWGCDGSGSQSNYKQKSDQGDLQDSSLLMTCLVPLQMFTLKSDSSKKNAPTKVIVWQNPRPSSARYCRAIKFEFAKETPENVLKERQEMLKEIDNLRPSVCEVNSQSDGQNYDVAVQHRLGMSMIDGKVCNILTETSSSQTCNLCGSTPRIMNQIDMVLQRPLKTDATEFGLSTLHAYIRFMEWLLHVSYRLEVKIWQVTADKKAQVSARQLEIQRKFRSETGLLIDVVKQGHGTTNDGNAARRFFADPEKTASITGLKKDLIERCATILRALSSGYEIDVEAFRNFAVETARYYVAEYAFYYMPASVHKILIHGAEVIKASPLPIGILSEDAQEARNKDFRFYRRERARKNSREATNEDILHMMLISSDPIITSLREMPKKISSSFSGDVLRLLKQPDLRGSTGEDSNSDSE